MVQGLGDTALEQTIIRWDVQSRPQGADIYWRVVSTTPEVKSTNNKYIMTTPYEATKALGIKGLTYQTAGNVRVILRCELDGYKPQEKEFDIRMVLDQEEISTYFKLVKEEKNASSSMNSLLRASGTPARRLHSKPHTALHFVALMWGY